MIPEGNPATYSLDIVECTSKMKSTTFQNVVVSNETTTIFIANHNFIRSPVRHSILAEGAIALSVTLSGGALFASWKLFQFLSSLIVKVILAIFMWASAQRNFLCTVEENGIVAILCGHSSAIDFANTSLHQMCVSNKNAFTSVNLPG